MNRRDMFAHMGMAAAGASGLTIARPASIPSCSASPPRKVIVGTAMKPFWGEHPGIEKRLGELTALVDRMRAESISRYRRGIDLAVLSETTVSGEAGPDALSCAVPLEGSFSNAFSAKAREFGCYIIAPTYLRESAAVCSNAAVLFGRKGELAGIYRKVHLVVSPDGKRLEGGTTPGREFPVFNCDFGRLAIQICYDMEFDHGWQQLSGKAVDLIAWPTQSPQTARPAARAIEQRCYIVSSTWRHNASIFEPTGKILAQLKPPGEVMVQEIDLSYAILPWTSRLRNGKALEEKFGARIGYRYYEDEDRGIFWSNDPAMPVGAMVRAAGFLELEEQLARVRNTYRAAGVAYY